MIAAEELMDELVFLQLSNSVGIGELTIKKGTNLPLLKQDFLLGIKKGNFEEEISWINFGKGLTLLAFIDPQTFEEYGEVFTQIMDTIYPKILVSIIEIKEKNGDLALACLEGLSEYKREIETTSFSTAQLEEEIYNRVFNDLSEEENLEMLQRMIKHYELVSDTNKLYSYAMYRLSYLYSHTGQYLKAKITLEKVLQRGEPEDIMAEAREHYVELNDYANMEAVEAYLSIGDLDKAIQHLEEVSEQYPYPDKKKYYASSIAMEQNQWEKAELFIQEAIQLNDIVAAYYEKQGFLYGILRDYEKSLNSYEKAVKLEPFNYALQYNLGVLYSQKGELEESIYHLKQAYNIENNEKLKETIENLEKKLTK